MSFRNYLVLILLKVGVRLDISLNSLYISKHFQVKKWQGFYVHLLDIIFYGVRILTVDIQ